MSACSSFDNFKEYIEARFKAHASGESNGSDSQVTEEALKVALLVAERLIPGKEMTEFEGREDGSFTLKFEKESLGKVEYLNPDDTAYVKLLHGKQLIVEKLIYGRVEPEKGRIAFDSRCIMYKTRSRFKPNPSFVAAGYTEKSGYTVTGSLVIEKQIDVIFEKMENFFVRWLEKK